MHSVNVTKLSLHLRSYLEQVQQGEEIVVTLDGKTIARIVPDNPHSKRDTALKCMESLRSAVRVGDSLAQSDSAWDSFFINGPTVSDDFKCAPARQRDSY